MSKKVILTVARISQIAVPEDKEMVFLWDAKTAGLGVRLKKNGRPAFVFQSVFQKKTLRITIGDCETWRLPQAHERARDLQITIDKGRDPRAVKAETQAKDVATNQEKRQRVLTVGEAWTDYIERGKPKKKHDWSERYKKDMRAMSDPGGREKLCGVGLTKPGPIAALLPRPLQDMTPKNLRAWHEKESQRGGAQAARAVQMFSGFLRWCSTQDAYDGIAQSNAARDPKVQDALPRAGQRRTDFLEEGQLAAWFSGLAGLENKTMAAYLCGLLLTGARKNEMSALKWSDIDLRWRKITLHDKNDESVERVRVIPLSPFFESVIKSLPKVDGNAYVFASSRAAGKPIQDARKAMAQVQAHAGIKHLTPHGLRRSFALLGEAAGCPSGAMSQIMGHQPGSMSERYKPRTVDQLRPFIERLESFVLESAGVMIETENEMKKKAG